jgi:hypothetical protein
VKANSPRKSFQDRSHSVDATHKFYRQIKQKAEVYERSNDEYMRAMNQQQVEQYKYGNGFNVTQNMGAQYVKNY